MPRDVVLEKPKKFRKLSKMRVGQLCFNPYFCDFCEENRQICGHGIDEDYRLYRKSYLVKK